MCIHIWKEPGEAAKAGWKEVLPPVFAGLLPFCLFPLLCCAHVFPPKLWCVPASGAWTRQDLVMLISGALSSCHQAENIGGALRVLMGGTPCCVLPTEVRTTLG